MILYNFIWNTRTRNKYTNTVPRLICEAPVEKVNPVILNNADITFLNYSGVPFTCKELKTYLNTEKNCVGTTYVLNICMHLLSIINSMILLTAQIFSDCTIIKLLNESANNIICGKSAYNIATCVLCSWSENF